MGKRLIKRSPSMGYKGMAKIAREANQRLKKATSIKNIRSEDSMYNVTNKMLREFEYNKERSAKFGEKKWVHRIPKEANPEIISSLIGKKLPFISNLLLYADLSRDEKRNLVRALKDGILKIYETRGHLGYEIVSSSFTLEPTELHKLFIRQAETLKEKISIYTVNGTYIRDNYWQDWTQGGHYYVSENYHFIPDGEIWIDENLEEKDREATIIHELKEYGLMKYEKLDYETAHDKANDAEKKFREKDPQLRESWKEKIAGKDLTAKELEDFEKSLRDNAEYLSTLDIDALNDWIVINHYSYYEAQIKPWRYISQTGLNDKLQRILTRIKYVSLPLKKDTTMFTITKKKHEKTGNDVWIAKLINRIDYNVFKSIELQIKNIGGYYSKYVKGFVFNEDPAEKLKSINLDIKSDDIKSTSEETKNKYYKKIDLPKLFIARKAPRKDIIIHEIEAGKMEYAIYKSFNGMTDGYDYNTITNESFKPAEENDRLKEELERAKGQSHWVYSASIKKSDDLGYYIDFTDYYIRYKVDPAKSLTQSKETELELDKGYTSNEIATKWVVSESYAFEQLMKGSKIELEHTHNEEVSTTIASQHLYKEGIEYYNELDKMEKKLKEENNPDILYKGITKKEFVVLDITATLKPPYREKYFKKHNVFNDLENIKESLYKKGFILKNGGITYNGRTLRKEIKGGTGLQDYYSSSYDEIFKKWDNDENKKIIEFFHDTETNMTSFVNVHVDGYSVTLRDDDSGEFLNNIKIFKLIEQAISYAKTVLKSPNENVTKTLTRSEFLDNIHPLDLWVKFTDGRYYRLFQFVKEDSQEDIRNITDRAIKEKITEQKDGTMDFILSVGSENEADILSGLFMDMHPIEKMKIKEEPEITAEDLFDGKPLPKVLPEENEVITYNDYVKLQWEGKGHKSLSKKWIEKELENYIQLKEDFENGLVKPSKIIGTGFKNPRKVAKEWLEKTIIYTENAIETEGHSIDVIQMNYTNQVRKWLKNGLISQDKAKELLFDGGLPIPDYIEKLNIEQKPVKELHYKKGDKVITTEQYLVTPIDSEGEVISSQFEENGDEIVKILFGTNQSGQKIINTIPAWALNKKQEITIESPKTEHSIEEIKNDLSKLAPEITEYFYKIPKEIRAELNVLSDFNMVIAYFGFKPFEKYINIDFEKCDGISSIKEELKLTFAKKIRQNVENGDFELGFKYLLFKDRDKAINDLKLVEHGFHELKYIDSYKKESIDQSFVYVGDDHSYLFSVSGYSDVKGDQIKNAFFKGNYMSFYTNDITTFNWILSYIMEFGEYVKDIDFFYNNKTTFGKDEAKEILNSYKKENDKLPVESIKKDSIKKDHELEIKKDELRKSINLLDNLLINEYKIVLIEFELKDITWGEFIEKDMYVATCDLKNGQQIKIYFNPEQSNELVIDLPSNNSFVGEIDEAGKFINLNLNTKKEELTEPKFKVGDYVKYEGGDVYKEKWYGVITKVVDLDTEYVYKVDAYGRTEDGLMFDKENNNQKSEIQLELLGNSKKFDELKSEYEASLAVKKVIGDEEIQTEPAPAPKPITEKPSDEGYELVKRIRMIIDTNGDDRESYSPDELRLLRQYTGMGGYASRSERGTIDTGLLDQFYTPYQVIEKIWGLIFKNGFSFNNEKKRILEPAVGVGRFLEYIPRDQDVVAYEIDKYAYTIAKISFPDFEIINNSFETMFFKGNRRIGLRNVDEKFDLVIGNPPYREYVSKYAVIDDASGQSEKSDTLALTFDQYMLMRGIDVLKEGGLLAFIIPSSFMANDKKYNSFKNLLAKKAKLIDAYRLPETTFPNTMITTDILILKKI